MILTDRFLLAFGYTAVLLCALLQFHRHALWFQQPNPYTHAAVSVGREAIVPSKGKPHSLATHSRSSIRAARPRCLFGTYQPVRPVALVGPTFNTCRLVSGSVVRPFARVGQLAHPQRAVRKRFSVHARHLDVSRRARFNVDYRHATRAVVSGLPRLETRRGELV